MLLSYTIHYLCRTTLVKIPNAQKQAEYQSSREQTGKHWPHPDFTDIFDSVHGSSFCGTGITFTLSDFNCRCVKWLTGVWK
jgi:hypothetical protein